MTQQQARRVIADIRADINSRGYEVAAKQYLTRLFNDLKIAYQSKPGVLRIVASGPGLPPPEPAPIEALERKWIRDRENAAVAFGADTIQVILSELERSFITLLPVTETPAEVKTLPPFIGAQPAEPSDADVDKLIERMRKRHHVALPA